MLASLDQFLESHLPSFTPLSQNRSFGRFDYVQSQAAVGGHIVTEPVVIGHGVVVGIAPLSVVVDNVLSVDAVKVKTKLESRLLGGNVLVVGFPLDTAGLQLLKREAEQGVGGLEHDKGGVDSRVEPDRTDFESAEGQGDIEQADRSAKDFLFLISDKEIDSPVEVIRRSAKALLDCVKVLVAAARTVGEVLEQLGMVLYQLPQLGCISIELDRGDRKSKLAALVSVQWHAKHVISLPTVAPTGSIRSRCGSHSLAPGCAV